MNPVTSFLVLAFLAAAVAAGYWVNLYLGLALLAAGVLLGSSLKMANVWQKFVILRLGKLQSVRGAGLFAIIPVLDSVIAIIDARIQTTAFNAEQALTRDTVPVNVDAIVFWHVHDAEKAALAITDYRQAMDRVAQTSLREMIGSSVLATLLSDRKQADEQLKVEIGEKTAPWGISVSSVEIRDVAIPAALQDAMSRQAQAEQARVILGSAEAAIASSFVAAADTYVGHPMALQLQAMNIIYETTKERGATILMPSSMVDSLNLSAKILGLALAGNEAVASCREIRNGDARYSGARLMCNTVQSASRRSDKLQLSSQQPPNVRTRRVYGRSSTVDTPRARFGRRCRERPSTRRRCR